MPALVTFTELVLHAVVCYTERGLSSLDNRDVYPLER